IYGTCNTGNRHRKYRITEESAIHNTTLRSNSLRSTSPQSVIRNSFEERIMPLTLKENFLRSVGTRRDKSGFLSDQSVIEARTNLLDPEDRNLLRAVLIYNQPTKVVAQINRTNTSIIRRRIRRLIVRISSPQFVSVARSLHLLNDEQFTVVKYHILQGRSLQATVDATSLRYHTIRRVLAEVDGIVAGLVKAEEKYPLHQERYK
ncbi:MAG: hypothetical protein KAV00_16905, partial [Phycisphaerae bacterium]|nr:hypothetical protein [Phycisphaerae bacterium]